MTSSFSPQTIDLSASLVQLIRTSLRNPKVTFDKTGLKAYDANGNSIFDIDAVSGNATISGILESLGIILPTANTTPTTPWQTGPNEIAWLHPDGTTVIASIDADDPAGQAALSLYSTGKNGENLPAEINLTAELAGKAGDANLHLQSDGTDAGTLVQVQTSNGLPPGGVHTLKLLDRLGNSDLQKAATVLSGQGVAFPATPYDGQLVDYQWSDAVNAHGVWRFRYDKTITDGFPWVFVGGQAQAQYSGAISSNVIPANVWTGNFQPALNALLHGIYRVEQMIMIYNTTSAFAGMYLTVDTNTNPNTPNLQYGSGGQAAVPPSGTVPIVQDGIITLTAGEQIRTCVNPTVMGCQFIYGYLKLTPTRVSG